MFDDLGDRMKSYYEDRTRILLPRKTYTIIRLDGKAFHSLTKKLKLVKPFDFHFMNIMNQITQYLCQNIQNCKLGYVQSDEISLLLTDLDDIKTDMWFDGNIQKITSISASMATIKFNTLLRAELMNPKSIWNELSDEYLPVFDSRVFTISNSNEVINYFIWRQKDCVRNSIQMLAQSLFSHKELQGKSCSDLQEMCFTLKNVNWNNCDVGAKRGRMVIKEMSNIVAVNLQTKEEVMCERPQWKIKNALDFNKNKSEFKKIFPESR